MNTQSRRIFAAGLITAALNVNEQQRKNLHESLSAMQHRGSHQAHSLFPWSSSTTLAKQNLTI
jgi:hypothetical protein